MVSRTPTMAMVSTVAIVLLLMVPVANASTVKVILNPSNDSAYVNACVNSTLEIKVSNNSYLLPVIQSMANLTSGNSSVSLILSGNSTDFQVINDSINEKYNESKLENLSVLYRNTVTNYTAGTYYVIKSVSSLGLFMNVSGIFQNGSANMSWRSFNASGGLDLQGSMVGSYSFDGKTANTIDFSAFHRALTTWTRTYDPSTNITTFTYDAGITGNYSWNWSAGGGNVQISLVIDPTYTISAPGYAMASGDNILLQNPPSQTSTLFYVIAGLLVAAVGISYYFARKKD